MGKCLLCKCACVCACVCACACDSADGCVCMCGWVAVISRWPCICLTVKQPAVYFASLPSTPLTIIRQNFMLRAHRERVTRGTAQRQVEAHKDSRRAAEHEAAQGARKLSPERPADVDGQAECDRVAQLTAVALLRGEMGQAKQENRGWREKRKKIQKRIVWRSPRGKRPKGSGQTHTQKKIIARPPAWPARAHVAGQRGRPEPRLAPFRPCRRSPSRRARRPRRPTGRTRRCGGRRLPRVGLYHGIAGRARQDKEKISRRANEKKSRATSHRPSPPHPASPSSGQLLFPTNMLARVRMSGRPLSKLLPLLSPLT